MRNIVQLSNKQNILHRKLLGYTFLLATVLIFCIFGSMFLLGQFTRVRAYYYDVLEMQLSVLEKEISDNYSNAIIAATQFSKEAGKEMEGVLAKDGLTFAQLENNTEKLIQLQDQLFEPLKNSMLQADTSGAFVVWDTTIRSDIKGNRNGLYLQLDTWDTKESSVIVYRGHSTIGKKHHAMPHRKWRLEYEPEDIPKLENLLAKAKPPIDCAHQISPVVTLPHTSEKAMLISLPIIGSDGTVYGLCGFEVGQMHFKTRLSQPTTLGKLTCMFIPEANDSVDANKALSCGIKDGYYCAPTEPLITKNSSDGLTKFIGENSKYIGVTRTIQLSANEKPSMLVVMIPKGDYNRAVVKYNLLLIITGLLLGFFMVVACLVLIYHFIRPVYRGLQQFRETVDCDFSDGQEHPPTGVKEIDELIALVNDKLQNRLPDEAMHPYMEALFNRFIELTSSLTPSEMNVLSLLIQGYSPKELPELLFISESTAKHHVLKIYKKLEVSSRGELFLYIKMMKGCGLIDKIATHKEINK